MTADEAPQSRTFIFETTHHAMWAEDVAREQSIPAEVVPAPPEADAKCGLALRTLEEQADVLAGALDKEGIIYKRLTI